jgi:hypothetical protein
VDVQDGAAPVEFRAGGVEEGIGECAAEYGRGHAGTDRPEAVEGAGEFLQGRVGMGQGQCGEGRKRSGKRATSCA